MASEDECLKKIRNNRNICETRQLCAWQPEPKECTACQQRASQQIQPSVDVNQNISFSSPQGPQPSLLPQQTPVRFSQPQNISDFQPQQYEQPSYGSQIQPPRPSKPPHLPQQTSGSMSQSPDCRVCRQRSQQPQLPPAPPSSGFGAGSQQTPPPASPSNGCGAGNQQALPPAPPSNTCEACGQQKPPPGPPSNVPAASSQPSPPTNGCSQQTGGSESAPGRQMQSSEQSPNECPCTQQKHPDECASCQNQNEISAQTNPYPCGGVSQIQQVSTQRQSNGNTRPSNQTQESCNCNSKGRKNTQSDSQILDRNHMNNNPTSGYAVSGNLSFPQNTTQYIGDISPPWGNESPGYKHFSEGIKSQEISTPPPPYSQYEDRYEGSYNNTGSLGIIDVNTVNTSLTSSRQFVQKIDDRMISPGMNYCSPQASGGEYYSSPVTIHTLVQSQNIIHAKQGTESMNADFSLNGPTVHGQVPMNTNLVSFNPQLQETNMINNNNCVTPKPQNISTLPLKMNVNEEQEIFCSNTNQNYSDTPRTSRKCVADEPQQTTPQTSPRSLMKNLCSVIRSQVLAGLQSPPKINTWIMDDPHASSPETPNVSQWSSTQPSSSSNNTWASSSDFSDPICMLPPSLPESPDS